MGYTEGDWEVTDTAFVRYSSYRGKSTGARTFVTSNLALVAEVQGDTPEEAEANARLIAAAPKLLEALKKIAPWLMISSSGKMMAKDEAIYAVREALALAEPKEEK